ncbi:MAG TPA: ABC transporter permease, partial [Flavisolibacter sp.]|nr:ABC transporter permease [Flavisolibacter sp.]
MSFAIALQSEVLKTKRTASFWMSILGAAFIPAIFLIKLLLDPAEVAPALKAAPWKMYFAIGWEGLSTFLFPMYIILVCALIPQIEFKNNTWKQVFASPQSTGQIYFSKFLTVHLMIFLCYLLFNVFMILFAVVVNLVHSEYTFLQQPIDWSTLMQLNAKTYISILGISAIQFWLSLRFK